MHNLAMHNLDGYDAFLEAWQQLFDDNAGDDPFESHSFADFERYASKAVQNFLEQADHPHGNDLAQQECPAALVHASGFIKQANSVSGTFGKLIPGRNILDCGIKLVGEQNIAKLWEGHAKDGPPAACRLIQAQNAQSQASINLVVYKLDAPDDEIPLFLLLFIVPPDVQPIADLMANRFNFTSAETEIARAFLEGVALRDIAEQRGRSYTTIRNQFQRILEKSGCKSQTELSRLSFSILQLMGNQAKQPQKERSKISRTVTQPRPNGRVLELILSGDESGYPVLSLPSLFGHGITPEIEKMLWDNNILLISLMRPGFGGTSVATKGEGVNDCLAKDVRAILDSLEIERCACIARASAARPFYNLLARLPNRFNRGVLVNGMIPREYIKGKSIVSKWTTSLMSASIVSYPTVSLILGTGNSLFFQSDGASFLKKMYYSSASDCACFDDKEVISSVRAGVQQVTQQGLGAGVQEMADAFQNWSGDVQKLQTPVTLYHGRYDPHVPILGVQEFARDNPHFLTLVEEPEGGGQLCYSHFAGVIDLALSDNN